MGTRQNIYEFIMSIKTALNHGDFARSSSTETKITEVILNPKILTKFACKTIKKEVGIYELSTYCPTTHK